jgi:hypothetical protein
MTNSTTTQRPKQRASIAAALVLVSTLACVFCSSARSGSAVTGCSLVTRAEVATVLGVPAAKLARSYTTSGSGVCGYTANVPGKFIPGFSLAYSDGRSTPAVYRAFRDHRYSGCSQGPKVGDKTCWDMNPGSPRNLTLFAKSQTVRIAVNYVKPVAAAEARIAALIAKIYRRLPG